MIAPDTFLIFKLSVIKLEAQTEFRLPEYMNLVSEAVQVVSHIFPKGFHNS